MHKLTNFVCFSFLYLFCSMAQGQFKFQFDQSIPVFKANQLLANAWAGGLNSAQINTIDLNGNGKLDLAIFDKTSGHILTYLYENGNYRFAPNYAFLFPADVAHFMILRDFNGNGKKDLFTSTPLGIRVYENIGNSIPIWQLKAPFLENEGVSGNIVNLQINQDDIPAIVDVDGDGDLDILAFTFTGFDSFIRYYRNTSMENYGNANELEYKLVTGTWGDFQECDCGTFAYGNENCDQFLKEVESQLHGMHPGGKSILAIDLDGNGLYDLLTSHEECDELYKLENIGTSNDKAVLRNSSNSFPIDQPANFPFLPSPYYEDLDGDGIKDLLVSPNMIRNLADQIDFGNSLWFYKNIGTTASPQFEFKTSSFLQKDMLDLGENAAPLLWDIDNDGDADLLIATNTMNTDGVLEGRVYYFENLGSSSNPSFRLVDEDFWGFSEHGLKDLQIQLIDLTGNGQTDLLLTASLNGLYRTYFLLNQNHAVSEFQFSNALQVSGLPFLFGYQAFAYDVDGDGNKELFFARPSGGLDLYKNTSTANNPNFQRIEQNYLGISDDFFRNNLRVLITDLNNDGKDDLLTADRSGELRIYADFKNFRFDDLIEDNILYNPVIDRFVTSRFGLGIQFTSGNLTNADYPTLLLGTRLGGIHLLRNTKDLPIPENRKSVKLFPVPSTDGFINVLSEQNSFMDIMTMTGKIMIRNKRIFAEELTTINVQNFTPGVYIARFRLAENKTETIRFIVN